MIGRRTLIGAAGAALAARPGWALDPGVASGHYRSGPLSIDLTHSLALTRDNTEGMLDRPRGIRLLLSDREVPVAAICGLAFPPVWAMAKAGTVRGLLIEFDPAQRERLNAVVLAPPEGDFSLPSVSLSDSRGLWERLDVSDTRIAGTLEPRDDMAFTFSAPVFNDRVKADLKGPEVQKSAPVKVLIARAEAIGRGDLKAAAALSTETAGAFLSSAPPEMLPQFRRIAPDLIRRLKAAQRVVVREQTAAVVTGPREWVSAALVNGAWKAAD